MIAHLSVRTVLATRLAKFMAAAIVVLAILPFTAPFSSFAAVEIVSEQILHAGASQLKTVQDTTDLAFLTTSALLLMFFFAMDRASMSDRPDVRRIRILVLRI